MSLHKAMMERRYGLSNSTSFYSELVFDPIFTPIFASIGFSTTAIVAGTTISAASIAGAIATTGLEGGVIIQ